MKEIKEDKGRVRPVVEGDFQCDENGNSTRFYEILSLVGYVKDDGTKIGYISKTNVPIGTPITNTDYWYPFQIIAVPKGDKGDKGDDGKSAYELYIEHGGTIAPVEAWLASLQGKDGKDGQPLMLRVTPDGQSLEISDDGGHTWYMFEKNFSKLRVLGYLNSVSELPRNADIGDIYGVKLPNEEVEPGHSAYELWINTVKGWNEDYVITKIYDYDTELPSYAAEGSTVVVPVKYLTLDKQKIDGYKVYRFDQAKNGWTMILNTAEIFASKEDIVNHGDNVYALVQGDSKKTYHDITNWINGSLDENNKYQEDLTSIIGTCPIDGSVRELSYNIANGYKADIRILTDEQLNPADIDNPTIVYDTEVVEGTGSITIPSNAKSIIVTMKSVNEEEEIPTSAGTMVSMYSVKEEKLILYKRDTGWVYFGTNASITYTLIQDVEEGTSTNILSGEAVKLKFAEFAAALDAFKQEVKDTYGDYEENPEFVRVTLDNNNKILYGVQANGNFYFGAGCPQQVKDYIEEKLAGFSPDEYESIVSFLNNLESGDKTLQELLNEKVDKEEGKSLIDKDFADGVEYLDNPEFVSVKLDSNKNILEATTKDGKKFLAAGLKVTGDVNLDSADITTIDNPEFIAVWLVNNKIIFGITNTADFYFGAGIPSQIKNYIDKKISEILGDKDITIIIDTLTEITSFLDGFVSGSNLLNYLNDTYGYYEDNPEFIKVYLDSNNKIVKAIRTDGTTLFGFGYEVDGIKTIVVNNPEFSKVYLDFADHIVFGFKQNGDIFFGYGVPEQIQKYILTLLAPIKEIIGEYAESNEFINVLTDYNRKILSARLLDGTLVEKIGFVTPNISTNKSSIDENTTEGITDVEQRLEALIDFENKLISYRDAKGIKHENAGIATRHIILEGDAPSDLAAALDELGYMANNPADWSDSEFVEIPIPEVCAVVNIGVDNQAEAKGLDIPTYIQFWDKSGNYFKKPIELNAQGSSSMSYHIKNQAIDFTDGSEIKFGNWPAFDSFHIKKYFIDVFRGQCIVAYWLTEQMYQTRPYAEKRPWDYLNQFNDYDKSNGSFAKDFESGAMAHPDGFPVHVFFNGKDAGIYAFNIKKARGNYNMKKDKQKQIILDGVLGGEFFMCNTHMENRGALGEDIWHDFEIRNPKINKDINGNKYDGDNPKEPSDNFITTKNAIKRLTTALTLVNAEVTTEAKRAKFEEFFNIPFLVDYELISQVIYNIDGYRKNWIWCCWDGNLWTPTSYDMDSIFGQHWNGASYYKDSTTRILAPENETPVGNNFLKSLYQTELRTRYKYLRDNGVFTIDNIVGLLDKWVKGCGYDNLKHDIEDIVTSPYIENGQVVLDGNGNPVLIPNTPSYRNGFINQEYWELIDVSNPEYDEYDPSITYELGEYVNYYGASYQSKQAVPTNTPPTTVGYVYPPASGGWYNSIQRIKNWLNQRFATLDTYYDYN